MVCGASDWMCPTWGVVSAAAFRPMCLPRNPTIKSTTSATTPTTAVPMISTRLPLPISTAFRSSSLFSRCVVMSQPMHEPYLHKWMPRAGESHLNRLC